MTDPAALSPEEAGPGEAELGESVRVEPRPGAWLSASGLSVQHGREVLLHYPDLTLAPAAALAVTGPSGSGKTTLLHLLAGLLAPRTGRVTFGGRTVSAGREAEREAFRRRHVGYLFQDFHLMPGLTALENVELGLRVAGVSQSRRRAREALTGLELGHRLNHLPGALSTGERQRVALARAVAHGPDLLLVDEPTAHLDRERAGAALDLLLRTARDLSATLVVVTHDSLVAQALPEQLELGRVGGA